MHNAVKGFLGVWGAISLGLVALLVFKGGTDASADSELEMVSALPTIARAAEAGSPQPLVSTGSTMLEQAILDAFPSSPPTTKAEKRKAQNAADFVGATINAGGRLCARLIEVQEAAPGQYGVGCITRRDGTGRANYLIDSRTGSVDEI